LILGLLMLMGMGQVICKNDNQNLIKAIYDRDHTEIKKLVASGVDVNKLDQDGFTALYHAVDECHDLESVKILIEQGHAEINDDLICDLFDEYEDLIDLGLAFYISGYDNIGTNELTDSGFKNIASEFCSLDPYSITDGKNALFQYADIIFEIIKYLTPHTDTTKQDDSVESSIEQLVKLFIHLIAQMKEDSITSNNMFEFMLLDYDVQRCFYEGDFIGTSQGVRSKSDVIKELERVVKQLEQINSLLKA